MAIKTKKKSKNLLSSNNSDNSNSYSNLVIDSDVINQNESINQISNGQNVFNKNNKREIIENYLINTNKKVKIIDEEIHINKVSSSDTPDKNISNEKIKKKRGRPRKNLITSGQNEIKENNTIIINEANCNKFTSNKIIKNNSPTLNILNSYSSKDNKIKDRKMIDSNNKKLESPVIIDDNNNSKSLMVLSNNINSIKSPLIEKKNKRGRPKRNSTPIQNKNSSLEIKTDKKKGKKRGRPKKISSISIDKNESMINYINIESKNMNKEIENLDDNKIFGKESIFSNEEKSSQSEQIISTISKSSINNNNNKKKKRGRPKKISKDLIDTNQKMESNIKKDKTKISSNEISNELNNIKNETSISLNDEKSKDSVSTNDQKNLKSSNTLYNYMNKNNDKHEKSITETPILKKIESTDTNIKNIKNISSNLFGLDDENSKESIIAEEKSIIELSSSPLTQKSLSKGFEILINSKPKKKRGRPKKKKRLNRESTPILDIKNRDSYILSKSMCKGKKSKKKNKKNQNDIKETLEIFSSPMRNIDEIMKKNQMDDDFDDIIPSVEEIFDWSCNECSREIKKSEINKNSNNLDFSNIIDIIFDSSDEEDLYVDKTLTIPGETVLAYYPDDKRYHPAKIESFSKKSKTYKLLFWTGYRRHLKRQQFYTKYQPEFLTVELGQQRTDKDDEELRRFSDEDLTNYIQEFIPNANKFLNEHSQRYKDFINHELNSIKTHKELIKSSLMGYLNTIENEYIIEQFKLALLNNTLVLKGLPITIKINDQETDETEDLNKEEPKKEPYSSPIPSGHQNKLVRRRTFELIGDSQKTSDSLMSYLQINEINYIDKLCRYILLPEFTIWISMKLENKDYKESEQFCSNYEKEYDWVTEVLHYRETFSSGRYFITEHEKNKLINL